MPINVSFNFILDIIFVKTLKFIDFEINILYTFYKNTRKYIVLSFKFL